MQEVYVPKWQKKKKKIKDNKFKRKLRNILVFYISVSFLGSFTKISISEANTQYSQPNSLSLRWDQNLNKNRRAAGVNRTQFSSINTLEGIILSLLIQESPRYTLNLDAKQAP